MQICEFRDLENILQIGIASWYDSCLMVDLGISSNINFSEHRDKLIREAFSFIKVITCNIILIYSDMW